ncbi:MAG: uL13 family ribosomal protein [Patescibacteria group bacterium]|jgi:large subunit ribosomal protein L13
MNNQKTIEIDASGKSLGRLASEIAVLLRGKDMPSFQPREPRGAKVIVTRINEVRLPPKPLKSYSGYPGGLHIRSREALFARNPRAVLQRTVRGMLPHNKWRDRLLKNLSIASS